MDLNYIDAEAIAEAVTRPSMRLVPIKTDEQLDMQSLHRVREERGITVRKGRCHREAALPGILEDATAKLSGFLLLLLAQLKVELA